MNGSTVTGAEALYDGSNHNLIGVRNFLSGLDRNFSEACREARSFPCHWRDLPPFILMRRGPQPKPDNTPVASQATQAKSYSFDEDIPAPPPTQATPPAPESDSATPTPKPPPPVPQTIFAAREQSVSELFLPYGRLLRCELVNTVDSTNIDTPIIGLVIEDAWNAGRLIIPVGTEIHGVPISAREIAQRLQNPRDSPADGHRCCR
jgi:hypothetical protein